MPRPLLTDLDFGGLAKVTGLPTPEAASDAAPKSYVDALDAFGRLSANYTLTSTTAAQKLFNWSTNGALSLEAGFYAFECGLYILSMSATAGNGQFLLKGGGNATLASIFYQVVGNDNSNPTGPGSYGGTVSVNEAGAAGMTTTGTGTGLGTTVRGVFDITAAGTIIPSIALQSAAAAIVQAGSFFRCRRLGPTGAATQGSWS